MVPAPAPAVRPARLTATTMWGNISQLLPRTRGSSLPHPLQLLGALLKLGSGGRRKFPHTECSLSALPVSCRAESLIETFPATNQSISESTMKDMLLSLRKTLFNDFSDMMAPLSATVQTNSDKIHYLETKMGELYSAHNDLVDAYTDQENENQRLQTKLTDLEDRSRRNNIKFRGIPESVPPNELTNFIQRLMKALLPSLSDIELCIDRAHRIPKPKFLPDTAPRDTLARIHYYHVKERVMAAAKQNPVVPDDFTCISLYTDISQQTAMNRKKLATLTKILQNNSVAYRWGFPTKLLVTWNGKMFPIHSVDKGIQLFKQWQLLPAEAHPPPHLPHLLPRWDIQKQNGHELTPSLLRDHSLPIQAFLSVRL